MKQPVIIFVTVCLGMMLSACDYNKGTQDTATTSNGGGSIEIISPAEGSTVAANQPLELKYKVNPSPQGNHVHISVDQGRPAVVRQMEGTFETDPLSPGEHTINIMEATSGHSPTGVEATLHVRAE
jgi:hypothetical protein